MPILEEPAKDSNGNDYTVMPNVKLWRYHIVSSMRDKMLTDAVTIFLAISAEYNSTYLEPPSLVTGGAGYSTTLVRFTILSTHIY